MVAACSRDLGMKKAPVGTNFGHGEWPLAAALALGLEKVGGKSGA